MGFSSHEYCKCATNITIGNVQTECKSYCDKDYYCKGYDFFDPRDFAYLKSAFHTVSSCPAECNKMSIGDTGDLINQPHPDFSGCHIKLGNV